MAQTPHNTGCDAPEDAVRRFLIIRCAVQTVAQRIRRGKGSALNAELDFLALVRGAARTMRLQQSSAASAALRLASRLALRSRRRRQSSRARWVVNAAI